MTRNTCAFLNPEEDITLCDANLPNISSIIGRLTCRLFCFQTLNWRKSFSFQFTVCFPAEWLTWTCFICGRLKLYGRQWDPCAWQAITAGKAYRFPCVGTFYVYVVYVWYSDCWSFVVASSTIAVILIYYYRISYFADLDIWKHNLFYRPWPSLPLNIIESCQNQRLLWFVFAFVLLCKHMCRRIYLPGFYSYTIRSFMHRDITDSDVWNTRLCVLLSQSSNANSMARPTVYIVYVDIRASSLNWYTVISCRIQEIVLFSIVWKCLMIWLVVSN